MENAFASSDGIIPNSFDPTDIVKTSAKDYPLAITLSLVATPTTTPSPTPTPTLTPGPGGGIGMDSSPWVFNMEVLSWLKVEGMGSNLGQGAALAMEGDKLYLGMNVFDSSTGKSNYILSVIDISDPTMPSILGEHRGTGSIRDIDVEDGYVYLTNGETFMDILDARNPQDFDFVSRISIGRPWKVRVNNQTAYISADSEVIRIYDVTNPRSPEEISLIQNIEARFDVDENLLVGHRRVGDEGVIYDIADPAQPTLISTAPGAFDGNNVNFERPLVVSSEGEHGMVIYDITNPLFVESVATCRPPDRTSGDVTLLDGDRLFAGSEWGLQVIDIAEPGHPDYVLASFSTPSIVEGIAVDGDIVYVLDKDNGLIVLRILDGATPTPTPEPRPDAVQVLTPNGGEVLMTGDSLSIEWRTDVPEAGTGVRFELRDSQGRVAKLGYGWNPMGEDINEVYVPLVSTGDDYRVRVISTWNEDLFDDSDEPFMISQAPVLVVDPNGGEVWEALSRRSIHWKNNRLIAGTAVFFELVDDHGKVADLGTAWDNDAEDVTEVIVPLVPRGSDYRVRVVSAWDSTLSDESDALFRIIGGPDGGDPGGSEAGEASVDPALWEVYE